ncbi:pentapeptide repeat-containing protein [Candidatus Poribacteria bacterium]
MSKFLESVNQQLHHCLSMKYWIVLLMLSPIAVGVNTAHGEWDWQSAKHESFEEGKYTAYIMVVGDGEPEPVQASDIVKALRSGKEIRLKHAKVSGALSLPPGTEIRQNIYFIDTEFLEEVDFSMTTFDEKVHFDFSIFSKTARFESAAFADGATFKKVTFRKEADFKYIDKFSGKADFSGAVFSEGVEFVNARFAAADFSGAKLSGKTSFMAVEFTEKADFSNANFLEKADFRYTRFLGEDISFMGVTFARDADFTRSHLAGWTDFSYAHFLGNTVFYDAKFSELGRTDFGNADFSERTVFTSATFSGNVVFSEATFSGEADFVETTFAEAANFGKARFLGRAVFYDATFQQMPDFGETIFAPESDLRRMIFPGEERPYSHTFYKALIKSHEDAGEWDKAHDTYFDYREERRKKRSRFWSILELIFIEKTFGYGVKPLFLIFSFALLWIPFSWFYLCFLHSPKRWLNLPWCLLWSLSHSLDNFTPGIDLGPLTEMLLKLSTFRFRKDLKVVIIAHSFQRILGWYLLALFFILFGKIWIQ